MAKIIVPALPTALEMERHLQSLVDDGGSAFRSALDLDVSHIDVRAEPYGVRITDVDIGESSIGVSFEVDYTIFNGCKNMNVDDSDEGFVRGVRNEDGWVFEEFMPPPKRSTVDEF